MIYNENKQKYLDNVQNSFHLQQKADTQELLRIG